jgi:hypothetical protein
MHLLSSSTEAPTPAQLHVEVAITLWQPWATLIALGLKRLETRSWSTSFRGRIAIHASKRSTQAERMLCTQDDYIREALATAGLSYDDLPRGAVVALSTIAGVAQMQEGPTSWQGDVLNLRDTSQLTAQERAFGLYDHGRYAWQLTETLALPKPQPCRGSQQIWKLPDVVKLEIETCFLPTVTPDSLFLPPLQLDLMA